MAKVGLYSWPKEVVGGKNLLLSQFDLLQFAQIAAHAYYRNI